MSAEACPLCTAPLAPEQEWCLRCGAAARTRLAATPHWRGPLIAIAVVAALSLGVLTAALVKLVGPSSNANRPVASSSAPTLPIATTPAVTAGAAVAPTAGTGAAGAGAGVAGTGAGTSVGTGSVGTGAAASAARGSLSDGLGATHTSPTLTSSVRPPQPRAANTTTDGRTGTLPTAISPKSGAK
jgi:hypothetical protein